MSQRKHKQLRKNLRAAQPVAMYLVAAGRSGASDLRARIPSTAPLGTKSVALIGAGALGAPIAIELAQAMLGELRLLDGDFGDVGNSVRWPLGWLAAGSSKVAILANFLAQAYPRTRVVPYHRQLGLVGRNGDIPAEMSIIEHLVGGADLILDCSAEFSVNYFFSDLARQVRIPYQYVSATHGAWGGIVFSQGPDDDQPCWLCLQNYMKTGEVKSPRSDPQGATQPMGCASPTFTGTSFDLLALVAEGTRTAVSTLVGGSADAYPTIGWNLGVLSLRDGSGMPVAPSWTTYTLGIHPACESVHKRPDSN